MTAEVRSYLERTIPERRRQQIASDESAMSNTVTLLTRQFDITEESARSELSSFLAANGQDVFVEIRPREPAVSEVDDVDDAIRAVDYQSAHAQARQRLIDSIIDYQIANNHLAGNDTINTPDQRIRLHRSAESLVDSLDVPVPEFLKGRDPKEDADLVELRSRYLRALGSAPEGLTRIGLAESTSTNYGRWRPLRDRVINHLMQTNQITRKGTQHRGRYFIAGSEPEDFIRETDRVRLVYEVVHENGPISRSAMMGILGNDSTSGRARVQDILDRLVKDRYITITDNPRGYPTYAVQ